MDKILFLLTFGFLIQSCASKQATTHTIKYYNENNVEISRSKFYNKLSQDKSLSWAYRLENSRYNKKLTKKEKRGNITNRSELVALLENETHQKLAADQPLIIIFHPGKDPCNSSGSATRKSLKNWYSELEDGIHQITNVKPIYIYKNNTALEKYKGIINWHKDPKETVEKLFFKEHYPCSSFVVISKNGDYISYFGEFPKEYLWEATQIISK